MNALLRQGLRAWRAGSVLLSTLCLVACSSTLLTRDDPGLVLGAYLGPAAPAVPREFRGVWVATVANIDWPSQPGLGSAQQQSEITAILDRAAALHLNAVLLQVRPSADAIYPSALEPWTEYLSGTQGAAPTPPYDPLALWIEQAHARGLELHAWINPYRARHSSATSALHAGHIANTQPAAVKSYGKLLWMDPAEPASRTHVLAVVADIVRRYDVDGVHIDDYFYPYPSVSRSVAADGSETFEDLEFPDTVAWQGYQQGGGKLSRADWRREQVNTLIHTLYDDIHAQKPWVKFGISPFGLGQPARRAPGISGFSQYDSIYADAEKWLAQGWLDYLAPQLYWPIAQSAQAFPVLLDTWVRENTMGRHIYPGLFTSRIDDSAKSWQPEEIIRQVDLARENPGAHGHVHFSMAALLQDRKGVATRLAHNTYSGAALPPPSPWLGGTAPPQAPTLTPLGGAGVQVTLPADAGNALWLAVWRRYGDGWQFAIEPAQQTRLDVGADALRGAVQAITVSVIGRNGTEGPRAAAQLLRHASQ